MAVFLTEMRNVYHRQWIGGFDPEPCAGGQIAQVPTGSQNRKRALKPAQIQPVAVAQFLLQIFQNGFSASVA